MRPNPKLVANAFAAKHGPGPHEPGLVRMYATDYLLDHEEAHYMPVSYMQAFAEEVLAALTVPLARWWE